MNKAIPLSIGAMAFFLMWYGKEQESSKHYKIVRVIDGDTVVVTAPFLPDPFKKELSLRINGVNTPEKTHLAKCPKEKKLGKKATEFTTNKIENAKDKKVIVEGWGKFGGRIIGDVIIDGNKLSELLIDKGYAVPYTGRGEKGDWC